MLQTEERLIGGVTYQVTQLAAPQGRKLLVRLYKVLGPTLGAALRGMPDDASASLGSLETGAIGDALIKLAEVISEEELEYVCSTLAAHTQFSREPGRWLPLKQDEQFHWAGRYHHMFQWIGFALQVNYAAFLAEQPALSGFVSALKSRAATAASPSPQSSTGNCTESPAAPTTQ